MMCQGEPFWLVWQPETGAPTHRHPHENEARAEAARLARNNPGKAFFVLRVMAAYQKTDVAVTEFPLDDIPF